MKIRYVFVAAVLLFMIGELQAKSAGQKPWRGEGHSGQGLIIAQKK